VKAPAGIPRGGNLERVVKVEVQPKPTPAQRGPAEVDLSLFQKPDRTERVVASSPNAAILSGQDIPVAPPSHWQPKSASGLTMRL